MLELRDVCDYTHLSEYKIKKLIKENKFPEPIILKRKSRKWFVCEIKHWVEKNYPFHLHKFDNNILMRG